MVTGARWAISHCAGMRLLFLVAAVLVVIVMNAWVSEDAFITLRVADNAVNGYGLRWNVAERVQVYTHPLWMLILTGMYAVTSEAYVSTIVVSVICAGIALAIGTFYLSRSYAAAIFLLVSSVITAPFVDYATSGLETALAYYLVAVFMWLVLRPEKSMLYIGLVTALLLLTRHDFLVLIAPVLVLLLWQRRTRLSWLQFFGGLIPFAAWEVFSLIYYGFLFPNTAYAKLNVDIPRLEVVTQGLRYVAEGIVSAPSIAVVILTAGWLAVRQESKIIRMLVLGIFMYVAYVIWVGGDFMSGRFLVAPFFAALLAVASLWPFTKKVQPIIFTLVVAAGIVATRPVWTLAQIYTDDNEGFRFNGIIDEKSFYFPRLGLVYSRAFGPTSFPWAKEGLDARGTSRVVVRENVGLYGYFAGPTVYIIDPLALTDPLLARVPHLSEEQSEHTTETVWRIGHFRRDIPPGYVESVSLGENLIESREIAELYAEVHRITRGPIWSKDRWRLILKHNLH